MKQREIFFSTFSLKLQNPRRRLYWNARLSAVGFDGVRGTSPLSLLSPLFFICGSKTLTFTIFFLTGGFGLASVRSFECSVVFWWLEDSSGHTFSLSSSMAYLALGSGVWCCAWRRCGAPEVARLGWRRVGCGGSSSDVAFRLSICLGTVDCFSLEFSRCFLFLRWFFVPRPSLSHAWSKFEPSSFCCSGSLRFLLFRSGVGGCWRLSVPARWLFRVSVLTRFLGSKKWSISSLALVGVRAPRVFLQQNSFLWRRRWRVCF